MRGDSGPQWSGSPRREPVGSTETPDLGREGGWYRTTHLPLSLVGVPGSEVGVDCLRTRHMRTTLGVGVRVTPSGFRGSYGRGVFRPSLPGSTRSTVGNDPFPVSTSVGHVTVTADSWSTPTVPVPHVVVPGPSGGGRRRKVGGRRTNHPGLFLSHTAGVDVLSYMDTHDLVENRRVRS